MWGEGVWGLEICCDGEAKVEVVIGHLNSFYGPSITSMVECL